VIGSGERLIVIAGSLVLICLATVRTTTPAMAAAMEPRIMEQQEFSVIGIQVRTSNAKEVTGGGAIPKQWARFFSEGITDKIPNKVDSTIYAVYTNYASDYNGEYDFIIGMKVSSVSDVPRGMVAKTVPRGKYAVVRAKWGQLRKLSRRRGNRSTVWTLTNTSAEPVPTKQISSFMTNEVRTRRTPKSTYTSVSSSRFSLVCPQFLLGGEATSRT
jgi:predicted transcriptional regulator YdeE